MNSDLKIKSTKGSKTKIENRTLVKIKQPKLARKVLHRSDDIIGET